MGKILIFPHLLFVLICFVLSEINSTFAADSRVNGKFLSPLNSIPSVENERKGHLSTGVINSALYPENVRGFQPRRFNDVSVLSQPTLAPTTIIATPYIISATLSSDGRYASIIFDTSTNKGGSTSSSFTCSSILDFTGDDVATCLWLDSLTIAIYPDLSTSTNIANALNVGSVIRLLSSNSIYSVLCDITNLNSACSQAVQQTVFVLGPSDPVSPYVSVAIAKIVSSCSPLTVDFTGCTGDGQRGWQSISVTVTANNASANPSALATYLKSQFSTKVPISVPSTYLTAETTYNVTVKLCNIFVDCATGFAQFSVTSGSSSAPVVSLSGLSSTTFYASSTVSVTAPAYVMGCGGTTTSVGLVYTWNVLVGTTAVSVSEVIRGNSLTIPAYALQTGQTYTIEVTVRNKWSDLKTTVSGSFTVQVSALVASLSPSTMQLLRAGRSLTFSAAGSYDPDDLYNDNGALSYTWTCAGFTLNGKAHPSCLLTLSGSTGSTLTVSATTAAINSTSTLTLRVSKDTRNTTASVKVQVIEGSAPLITMQTGTSSVTSINTANALLISGLVQSDYDVSCVWSATPTTLNLETASLTSYKKSVTASTPTLANLYLAGNSLAVRSTYVFTLTCLRSAASISVTTNGPPVGGTYSISPTSGIEMSQLFTASTSQWSDTELPITYLFGFISPSTGLVSTIQSRSSVAYVSATLPGGRSTNAYLVNTIVLAFDSLNSSARLNQTVTVTPLPATDVASTIVSKLNATKGSTNLNDLKAVISVASSVISRVSCDSAPSCSSLNRASCANTANTCGACLDGYVGQQGDSNTQCVSGGSSTAPQQQCVPSDCSSHGTCKFFDRTSGLETSSCSVLSSTCFAQCVCSADYYGTTCAFTSAELQDQQSLRSDLLASLSYVANNEDTTAESVNNLVSSISGIIQTANDVNTDSVNTFSTMAQTTLSNAAADTTITADSLAGLLGPTDAAIAAQSSATGNDSALAIGNSIISAYAAIVSRDAAAGLPATTLVYDNFRFAQQTVDPADTVTLKVPQTGAESSTSSSVSSISLVSSGSTQNESSVSLQVVQYNSNLLSVNNSKYSGILQAQFSTSGDHTVLLTLTNTAGKIGPQRTDTTPLNYTTSCTTGDYGTYTYTCPVSEEQIVHKCHGIKGNLMTYCPVLATVCSSVELSNATVGLNLDGYTCSVSNMTAQFITCKCYPDDTDSRRRLSATSSLQGTGVLTAVAMAQYTAFEVGETFKAAPDLTSPEAISRALIVIAMFTVLWAGGLILISGCFIRQRQLHQENLERKLDDAGKTQKSSENSSVEEIRERLTKYVDSVFPVIFYPGHLLLRLKDEIRRNHKYLMMFMLLEGELEGKKRFINGIQLLTIQSALMFLLALLYDIQSPSDDGSCPGYTAADDCLKRKSVFDSSRSYCDWTDSPTTGTTNCTFNSAEVSFQATIYIQVIVSVASALIMRPLTYLFDVLLAPNVDNIKAKLAEEAALKSIENVGANRQSMVGRMTRRVGRVANSVASMIKFAQPKQVDPKELENMPVTLIPDEVEMVHTQARAYFRKLTQRSAAYEEKASTNPEHGHKSMRFTMMKRIQTTYAEYMGKVETEHVDAAEKKWEELKGLIKEQRALLKPEELAEYDDQWGLDPATGEFLVANPTDKKLKDVEKIIQKELAIVERTSQETVERLHLAVDSHVGLEILHKFILDILGRDTPAGRIFANKTEEDFRRSSVQTRRAKIFAVVCIVAANALFVYYSILRGYVKGVDWQKSYLIACLVQMMLEIYLFETIECLWINVFIPSLVSSEVQRVNNLLLNIINDLCNKAIMGQKLLDESKAYSLDVTKFLFTSNRIASVHPTLMESMMVRSYHTHLPGELSRKWSASGETKVTTGFFAVRNHRESVSFPIAMIGSVILTLQIAAMTPFDVQKMFLRFIQPFLYGGLVLFGKSIISNPIYIAITVLVIAILAGLLMYQYWKSEAENDEARMSKVQPISPVPIAEEAKPFDPTAGDLAKKKEMEYLKAQRESLRQKASAWAVSESKSHSSDSESTHGGKEYNIRTAETARRINSGNKNTLKASASARKAPVIATASSVSQDGKDDKAVYHQWESSEEKSEMGGGESYLFSSSENPTSKLQTTLKDDDEDDLGQLHKPRVTPAKAKAKSMTTGSSAAHSIDMESFTSQSLDDSFHPVK